MDVHTDPTAQARRNAALLAELRPQLLVADGSAACLEALSADGVAPLLPTSLRASDLLTRGAVDEGGRRAARLGALEVLGDDALCYAYTGGTTGRRRCVVVTQRMATHEIAAYPGALGVRGLAGARVLQPSSVYWAAAVFGQLDLALAFQGCAVVTEAVHTYVYIYIYI